MKITVELLKELPPHTIFLAGVIPETRLNIIGAREKFLKWVAVRGGIADWAVYVGPMDWSFQKVAEYGDKVFGSTARVLVDCDEGVPERYRY